MVVVAKMVSAHIISKISGLILLQTRRSRSLSAAPPDSSWRSASEISAMSCCKAAAPSPSPSLSAPTPSPCLDKGYGGMECTA